MASIRKLTDDHIKLIKPLLPKERGVKRVHLKKTLNGTLHALRTGCPWRDMPSRFGNHKTACNMFRRYSLNGVWNRIHVNCPFTSGIKCGMQEPPAAPLWPRREGKADMEAQQVMDPQPSADMSLAFGVLRGAVPFSGQCRVNGAFRDVTGKMYWSTQVPAPDEGTSGLDVSVYFHARDHEIDTAACEMRLECGEVRSLLAESADTEAYLLAAAMENARARGQGEFDVRIAR